MDLAHTPAPWVMRPARPRVNAGGADIYADVHTVGGGFVADCGCHEQADANARLIAASPALLAAARNALTRLDREDAEKRASGQPAAHDGVVGSVNDQLRAAITQAEGR